MEWIDADNAADYLRRRDLISDDERTTIEPLAGGVSNQVLYVAVTGPRARDFVLKQARPQLRTVDPWFCGVERIEREIDVLRVCRERLTTGALPRLLFEDRENYAFAMTAAPREHVVWKRELLAGHFDGSIATACGRLLGEMHAATWLDHEVESRLGDWTFFEQLRLDPYYRHLARAFPQAAGLFDALIESAVAQRCCLVHADFSPKNLLVFDGGLMMVDFETGHYGDPAFDLGFFLSHLTLKAFYHRPNGEHGAMLDLIERFWHAYSTMLLPRIEDVQYQRLVQRGMQHLAGCAWARLDGKSKVEYLDDETQRRTIRRFCQQILAEPPQAWGQLTERLERVWN